MILEFKKKERARQAHGRGSDNGYIPGTQSIILNGTEVGQIIGRSQHFTAPARWEIVERWQYDRLAPRWDIGQHIFSTLKEAKRHIQRSIKKRYPEAR